MNQLPEEIFLMILDLVGISDILNNCRLVSKRWLNTINQCRFKELIIYGRNIKDFNHAWFHTCRPINSQNVVNCWNGFNILLNSLAISDCFKSLKYLKFFMKDHPFQIEQLNELAPNLEHLEINFFNWYYREDEATLKLKNLKILAVSVIRFNNLIICSDKLEILKTDCLNRIKLTKSETLRCLEVSKPEIKEDYRSFSNLEIYKQRDSFGYNALEKMPKSVKEIHFSFHLWKFNWQQLESQFSLVLRNIKHYLNKDVVIFVQGIKMNKEKKNEYFEIVFINDLRALFKHDERLEEKLDWFIYLDYGEVRRLLGNQKLPIGFLKKLVNIQEVLLREPVNQDLFVQFLSFCPNLRWLKLSRPSFDQQFYDNFLCKFNALMCLEFEEDGSRLNLEFVINFRLLTRLVSNQSANVNLLEKIMPKLKIIEHLEFINGTNDVCIKREIEPHLFELKYGHNKKIRNLTRQQLVDRCKKAEKRSKKFVKSPYNTRKRKLDS